MTFLHTIGAAFIFAPFLVFFLIFFLLRKKMRRKAFGLAADVTTFLLFVSVPVSVDALWGYSISTAVNFIALILAIALLVIEWKKTKDLWVGKFVRKIWRIYFLVLSLAYLMIWLTGIVLTINEFF